MVALSAANATTPGASHAFTPAPSTALIARTAVGESISSVYDFAEPFSTPPFSRLGRKISSVRGENRASSGIVTVSAPHR